MVRGSRCAKFETSCGMQQKNAGGDVEKYILPLTKNISYTQYTKKILNKQSVSVFNNFTWSMRNAPGHQAHKI